KGEGSLRREPIAWFEGAACNFSSDSIGQPDVFEPRHYCTESNVFLAPIQLLDHLWFHKPEIAPRRPRAIRNQGASAFHGVGVNGGGLSVATRLEKENDHDLLDCTNRSRDRLCRFHPHVRQLGQWPCRALGTPGSDQSAAGDG